MNGWIWLVMVALVCAAPLSAQEEQRRLPESTEVGPAQKAEADTSEALPTLDMKEYIITGREKVELDVKEKRVISPGALRESVIDAPEVTEEHDGREFRTLGYKAPRGFERPDLAAGNSAGVEGGRYRAFGGHLSMGATVEETEFYGRMRVKRTGEHISHADAFLGEVMAGTVSRLENGATVGFNVGYRQDQYNFYKLPGALGRTLNFGQGQVETRWNEHEEFQLHAYLGGEFGQITDDGYDNGREGTLRTGASIESLVLGTLFQVRTDLRQSQLKNIDNPDAGNLDLGLFYMPTPTADLLYWQTRLGFERTLGAGFRIAAGVNVFKTTDNVKRDINKIYPYGALTKTLPGIGEIFGRYEPSVLPVGMFNAMRENPYLAAYTPLSHEYRPRSVSVGWRKRIVQDLTWEVAYQYFHVRNRAVELETGELVEQFDDEGNLSFINGDRWVTAYGNRATANGILGMLSWQANRYVRLYGNMRVLNYNEMVSDYSAIELGEVPYHANMEAQFAAEFFPGAGFGILVDGVYMGRRYSDPFKTPGTRLPSYLLANVTLQQSIGEHVLITGGLQNILNKKYEVWQGYLAPDFSAHGGLQILW